MAIHTSHLLTRMCLTAVLSMCCVNGVVYLQDYCGKQYSVFGEITIKLFRNGQTTSDVDCSMTLRPSSGTRLRAKFTAYTRGDVNLFGPTCDRQAIFLNDFFNNDGYCSVLKPAGTYDLGRVGTYRFKVHQTNILWTDLARAELLVTEVTNKTGGSCQSGFFDCESNNECIDDDLTCNGNDNCGNNRDEIEGCGLTTGIIVGIVFGVLGFIALVIVAVVVYIKCFRN